MGWGRVYPGGSFFYVGTFDASLSAGAHASTLGMEIYVRTYIEGLGISDGAVAYNSILVSFCCFRVRGSRCFA